MASNEDDINCFAKVVSSLVVFGAHLLLIMFVLVKEGVLTGSKRRSHEGAKGIIRYHTNVRIP
jgi:hypothetical protein